MGRKSKSENIFEQCQLLETFQLHDEKTNTKIIKYIVGRLNNEYHFFIIADNNVKLIASSHSGAFEKERNKWGK